MRIIVDVDGTLWNFHKPLLHALNIRYDVPKEMPKEWNWYKNYITTKQFFKVVDQIHASQINYRPYSYADEFLYNLSKHNVEVFIASHRQLGSAPILAKWLNKYSMNYYSGLYTGPNKLTLVSAGDILIDDAPHTAEKANKKGANVFVPAWPWNNNVLLPRYRTLKEMEPWIARIVAQK